MSLQEIPEMKDSDAITLPCAELSSDSEPAVKSRVEWVDASRALAMFFIMWQHTRNSPEWIIPPVVGALCLFFILAGYFLPRSPEKCLRRSKDLFIAWCLWSLISYLVFITFSSYANYSWQVVIGWGRAPLNYPLWFLKDLIIFQSIMCILMYLRFLPAHAWVMLVLVASFSYTNEEGAAGPLRFSWMIALVLGYALADISLKRIAQYMRKYALLLVFVILMILIQGPLIGVLAPYFDLSSYSPKLVISSFAYAMLFVMLALALEKLFPLLLTILALIGRCTMFIYAMHALLYYMMLSLARPYLGRIYTESFLTPLILLIILVPVCLILQHFFPRLMTILGCPPSRG